MTDKKDIAKTYKKTQIESASPGRLIVLLYEGAIDFLNKAEQVYREQPDDWIEQYHNLCIRAQNIITELTVSLDMERGGDLAGNLLRLYEYMNRRLVEANMDKQVEPIDEVRRLLEMLLNAWREVQDSVPGEAAPQAPQGGINLQG